MKLAIPEPCSEDWSKMTPTEQGAFCRKCALEVTDFTDKTSLEIKEILTSKMESKQRVCGHIENRQMIEFNSEFILWKSDQELFRAVWMYSLIAVFGMTLFSCQSNFSKEIVEKMNVSSMEMMDDETKDTLDLAKLNDSIKAMSSHESPLVVNKPWPWDSPYEITGLPMITQGGFGGGPFPFDWKITTCTLWLGDLIVSGSIAPTSPVDPKTEDQAEFIINHFEPIVEAPNPLTQSPRVNDRTPQNSQRIDAKHEKGKPDFEAHISPLPIDETSKLFLTIPDEGMVRMTIWELSSQTKVHTENLDLIFGNHRVDINFMDFPVGKYAIQLVWEDEKIVVPFEVTRENLA